MHSVVIPCHALQTVIGVTVIVTDIAVEIVQRTLGDAAARGGVLDRRAQPGSVGDCSRW